MTEGTSWWLASSKSPKEEIRAKGTLCCRWATTPPSGSSTHSLSAGPRWMRRCLTARVPTAQSIINAYKDSRQFFQVHMGYTTMSDEELGLNTLISRDEGGSKSITARGSGTSEEMVLQLGELHFFQHAIVFCGTICFLANKDRWKV
ncbi:hypothetical protein GX48_07341 [Paracoccidioides brasiliensis]|nr:hypothetical protein GX48_07341 [Paracoccidioides brasiliensis]